MFLLSSLFPSFLQISNPISSLFHLSIHTPLFPSPIYMFTPSSSFRLCSAPYDLAFPTLSSTPFLLHTSISVLSFCLDSRWGLHAERVALGKGQTYARSVPGMTLLQAADRALTSCHLTSDLLVADVSITQGRHYWACSVEPGSYLVKVNIEISTLNWSEVTVKPFIMLQKMTVSNKCCSFELSVHQRILKEMYHSFHKILISTTVFNSIENVSWAPNQHIRMISEGSCDTEDWSNDAENSALHYRNKWHLKYIK